MSTVFENAIAITGSRLEESGNPYELSPAEVQAKTAMMFYNCEPFISHRTHSDIDKDLHVFVIDGKSPFADVARAVEGRVYAAEWGQTPEQSRTDQEAYESNSGFFVLVRKDPENPDDIPEAIGCLRVAISHRPGDPLESRDFYYREVAPLHDNGIVPRTVDEELGIKPGERELWDVVGVAVDKQYRRSNHSATWLYHALYAMSQLQGVDRWLANVHEKEQESLHTLGIPFEQISGSKTVRYEFPPIEGKAPKVHEFIFSVCDPSAIRSAMEKEIARLEAPTDDKDMAAIGLFIAGLARIALNGRKTA